MRYLSDADIDNLRSICGPEHTYTGEDINEDFAHDELGEARAHPAILLEPESTDQVARIMEYAYENRIPVTVRGSGTGLCGACVPEEGGVLICTSRMDKVLEIDERNLMATVQPGVILLNFQDTVEKMGLFYPPDPGEKSATIGGNVATNAGGMRAVKYGVTRDYVTGLEVVLPNGEVVELGGKVVKNSSGYSLLNLFIGSEGTLGVITKITVKLLPLPKKSLSLLAPYSSLQEAIDTVPQIIQRRILPTAIEFMQRDVIMAAEEYLGKPFPHNTSPAYLLLRFDGNSTEELESIYIDAGKVCLETGAEDVLIADTTEREEMLWSARGVFLEALKAMSELDEVDVVVPRDQIAVFINYTKQLGEQLDIRILSFGHAGDGNMHVYMLRDDLDEDTWQEKRQQVMERMYTKGRELGGQVSGEHGIGLAKKAYLRESLHPLLISLMAQIKAAFDSRGVLNPGKVFDTEYTGLQSQT